MKSNRMYNAINIAGGIVCVILIVMLFIFNNHKILIGVLFRGTFALLILYNALYVIFTKKPSFMVGKENEKHRIFIGMLLFIVGIFGFVTTLLGYGINGYPLFNWRTIF